MFDIPKDVLKKIDDSIEDGPLEEIEDKDSNTCYGCTGSCSETCVGNCMLCCVGTCVDGCSSSCLLQLDVRAWLDSQEKACRETDEGDAIKK